MNYSEMLKFWDSKELFRFDFNILLEKGVDNETAQLLSIVGLPTSAAPFLSFGHNEETKKLDTIQLVYETDEFAHKFLLVIGSESAGDPICIDIINNCQVVVLNHGQELESTFVNTSAHELLQLLEAIS